MSDNLIFGITTAVRVNEHHSKINKHILASDRVPVRNFKLKSETELEQSGINARANSIDSRSKKRELDKIFSEYRPW